MKKFVKLLVIPVSFLVCSQMTSCNLTKKDVALITDVGDIDDGSFNQTSWEAVKGYCTTNKKTYDYYRPFADSDFARRCAIKQAIHKGATMIVCPGFKFADAVNVAQKEYPNVHFVLLDAETADDVGTNTVCIGYRCDISGYLAGFSVASDYFTYDIKNNQKLEDSYNFGYCGGMANDGVLNFGIGMVQGIVNALTIIMNRPEAAGLSWPKINIRFNYAGVFAQSDDAASLMKGWYSSGYKCVFACGGKLYQSIVEGVKDFNRKNNYYDFKEGNAPREAARWIGVDSDQYVGLTDEHAKKTIYTSALKGLGETIRTCLDYHYSVNGLDWNEIGGAAGSHINSKNAEEIAQKQWILGLNSKLGNSSESKDYVGIPTAYNETTKVMRGFNNFKIDTYKELTKNLGNNSNFVYSGNCTDIIDSDGKTLGDSAKGDPTFMSNSKNYYYREKRNDSTFYDWFFKLDDSMISSAGQFPADHLICTKI